MFWFQVTLSLKIDLEKILLIPTRGHLCKRFGFFGGSLILKSSIVWTVIKENLCNWLWL